jgi:hypothetical protein
MKLRNRSGRGVSGACFPGELHPAGNRFGWVLSASSVVFTSNPQYIMKAFRILVVSLFAVAASAAYAGAGCAGCAGGKDAKKDGSKEVKVEEKKG